VRAPGQHVIHAAQRIVIHDNANEGRVLALGTDLRHDAGNVLIWDDAQVVLELVLKLGDRLGISLEAVLDCALSETGHLLEQDLEQNANSQQMVALCTAVSAGRS
jgi:hypothetical protein